MLDVTQLLPHSKKVRFGRCPGAGADTRDLAAQACLLRAVSLGWWRVRQPLPPALSGQQLRQPALLCVCSLPLSSVHCLCASLPLQDAKLDTKSERGVINEVADLKVGGTWLFRSKHECDGW